jgi:DNA (cytosine-5)-methyltransferase 1
MTFIDFFAGIGGIRTAFEAAGHKCLGFVEIDRFAAAAYRAIHGVNETYGPETRAGDADEPANAGARTVSGDPPPKGEFYASDIRTIDPVSLPAADLYVFGFPCQPFSCSGNRKSFEDTRGTLIFEILRLAAVCKPRHLFAENVAGLLNISGGSAFHTILNAMGELGYFCEWQLINSAIALPQSRPRVYIAGHAGGIPARTVFPVLPQDAEPRLIIAGNLNIKGRFKQANRVYSPDGISPCLDTSADRPNILTDDGRVRHLTSLEKWRLQGFSDEAYYKAAGVCSEAQLHRQAGNSVSIPVIYEIAKRFRELEEAGAP